MTVLPQLERQLRAAHRELTTHSHGGRRPQEVVRAVPVLVLVLVAMVLAVGAIALVRGRGGPVSTSAAAGSRARLTRVLRVLRRPQTAADRSFDARGWPEPPRGPGSSVRPDRRLVRLAAVLPSGEKVFVVPLTAPRDRLLRHELGETVALWVQGIGWSDYSTVADVENGQAWGPQGPVREPGGSPGSRFFEVVPDGVAKVTFYNAALFGKPTGSVMAIVHDNVAVFQDTGGTRPIRAKWFAADGRLIRRIGAWNLIRPGPLTGTVREVLRADGIGGVRFGASPTVARAKVGLLLGQRGLAYKRYLGQCGVDHLIVWIDDHTANGLPSLDLYFGHSKFLGYEYGEGGTMIPPHQPLQGPELATARGLRIGDTLARGRRLYGRAFRLSYAQGGAWTLRIGGRVIAGYAWGHPRHADVSWQSIVETIDAGNVGCPALSP